MSLYLIEIPLESQLSILKNVCEEASESETWRETMGGSQSSRAFQLGTMSLSKGQSCPAEEESGWQEFETEADRLQLGWLLGYCQGSEHPHVHKHL